MKIMKRGLAIVIMCILGLTTQNAHAETFVWSGKTTIEFIQNPGDGIIMLNFGPNSFPGCQNDSWMRFSEGLHGNNANDIDRHLSMAMTAMAMGWEVNILYDEDSPNCTIKYFDIFR